MTVEYQETPEERAFDQLVDEQWESLSEAARAVFEEAMSAAYREYMVHSVILDPRDYEAKREKMRLAAAELPDHDFAQLAKMWRSALAAASSVDPYDYETLVKYRVYRGDLHGYYRMFSGMVEDVLWEKRHAEFQKELAEQEPLDDADIPF